MFHNEIFLRENYGEDYILNIQKYKKIYSKIKGEIQKERTKKYLEKPGSTFKHITEKKIYFPEENRNYLNRETHGSLLFEINKYKGYWDL